MPGIDVCAELGEGGWTRADRDGVLRALQRARFSAMILASRRGLAGDLAGGNAELKAAIYGNDSLYGWFAVSPVDLVASIPDRRKHAVAPTTLCLPLDPAA